VIKAGRIDESLIFIGDCQLVFVISGTLLHLF
jgi:hypothetical protein